MKVESLVEGLRTPFGQAATHNWQPVHFLENELTLNEPAGFTGISRSGIFLSSITASPPSVVLSWAWSADVAASVMPVVSIARSVVSGLESFDGAGLGVEDMEKDIAFFLHLPMQFMHETHRE
jgi:hypothetical protein